jgi:aminoglycoside phosphotransferase (APT) family kinase protein
MPEIKQHVDKSTELRQNDFPEQDALLSWTSERLAVDKTTLSLRQFPGGYSNLTYELQSGPQRWVLRMPPIGADIKSAHDMGREFKVLSLLKPVYPLVPTPILYCGDITVMGRPFYLMEKLEGIILRNKIPEGLELSSEDMLAISTTTIENLARLHMVELDESKLSSLGKPEGYIGRQVEGWITRYEKSKTERVPDMELVGEWMKSNQPKDGKPAFIHNDYKYDNLVLNPENPREIKAVLDWEMATVGDPLMDLGTTLAYWAEATEGPVLKPFNLTWLPGNLNRAEVVNHYALHRGIEPPDMLFYFAFGSYKIAVIVQQIYARYQRGLTADPRFANLHFVVKACARNAVTAIQKHCISNLES